MRNKKSSILIIGIIVIISLIIIWNFLNSRTQRTQVTQQTQQTQKYWTCGMHPSVKSDKPGNCPICGMNLFAVYKEEPGQKEESIIAQEAMHVIYGCGVEEEGHCPHCDEGKIDADCICGQHSFMIMDKKMNCPVCGRELKKIEPKDIKITEENIVSSVTLKGRQIELAGITTTSVVRQHLIKEIRTVGKIAFDPELAVAQEEFLTAAQTKEKVKDSPDPDVISRADNLVEKSRFKLRLLGMGEEEIDELENRGKAQLNLVLPENKAWVYADVYEYELGWVKLGQEVLITAPAYPGEEFKGEVKSISPVLDPRTRSAKIRIETDNPVQKLKPEMFVDVIIESMYLSEDGSHEVLAIQKGAVLDTGTRKIVYVDNGEGRFSGKEVKIGPEAIATIEGQKIRMYPVLKGLSDGEIVVTKGNFLIDSQSQLTGGMSVLWGGAQEIETTGQSGETEEKVQTQHRH